MKIGVTITSLCDSCTNIGCEFQSGIVRTKCTFYMPDSCRNHVVKESTTKNYLGVDYIDRNSIKYYPGTGGYMYASKGEIDKLPSVTLQEPRKGHWAVQPSNKEQGERDFIWWKCSECGQVIFSETEKDRKEFHAFCSRCGAKMESEESK